MKILVDADACPVKDAIIKAGLKYNIHVFMFIDTSHSLYYPQEGVDVITVDKGNDSVDFFMVNKTATGDIAITSDYGLAAMLLAKKAYVVHPNGYAIDSQNIDSLLFNRHIAKEMRRQSKGYTKIKKRNLADNQAFENYFFCLCEKLTQ